jgi:hypothetical protein
MVHVKVPEVLHSPKTITLQNTRKDEVHVNRILADVVNAREPDARHERDTSFGGSDIIRAAFCDQCDESREQGAPDLALSGEKLLNRVIATRM